jgi:hypothetical protein
MNLLGDLEGPEQADTPEDGHAQGRHDLLGHQHELQDTRDHHEKVKPVEQGHHVAL